MIATAASPSLSHAEADWPRSAGLDIMDNWIHKDSLHRVSNQSRPLFARASQAMTAGITDAFADTYYYLALLSDTDEAHLPAVQYARSSRLRTVTTDWILTEVGDAIANPTDRLGFAPLVQGLRSNPYVTIVPFSFELFERGIALYTARQDKYWSLTDCISFVIMHDYGLRKALTRDRHFVQAGFRTLL